MTVDKENILMVVLYEYVEESNPADLMIECTARCLSAETLA